MWLPFLFLVVTLGLLSTPAYAKCGRDKCAISGVVRDCHSQKPVQGATVFVFLDDYEQAHGPMSLEPFDESWGSAADGHFEATTYFDRFKPDRSIDDCRSVVKRIELFIIKAGYFTTRKEFNKVKIVQRGMNEKLIRLPEICIENRH